MIILRIQVMKGNQNEFVNLKFKILRPDSKKKPRSTHRLHAVDAEGDAGAGPEAEQAAGAAHDPGEGARLLLRLGRHRGLAVRAGQLHRPGVQKLMKVQNFSLSRTLIMTLRNIYCSFFKGNSSATLSQNVLSLSCHFGTKPQAPVVVVDEQGDVMDSNTTYYLLWTRTNYSQDL